MNVDTRQVLRDTIEETKFEAPEGVHEWPIMRRPRTKVNPPVPTELTISAACRGSFHQGITVSEYLRIKRMGRQP
ncbi:hypothetical protein [Salinibacter phage M31CR41-2]|uniref:Uncharacterized protein n=1 Tax=Salinibacter phage M31CR41-2 TaxID=2681614 RepID=A0A2I6UH86_9CAUD|nr:hypothetical protein FGG68_gp50 [Salinibacter phage M31CR41-2]AUO79322.1 hypothetical protein [Salinibacter phage M31CR41-2]AUO79392.1 hypothetical protein [Salinibacter virus M31CR41-3]